MEQKCDCCNQYITPLQGSLINDDDFVCYDCYEESGVAILPAGNDQ
ncbi:hypothetical protein ACJ2A9_17665 [Anaerobacillus sp. MEB173]